MKNVCFYFTLAALMAGSSLQAQMDFWPVPWSLWLHNQDDGKPVINTQLDAVLSYLDDGGNTLYTETHTGSTNDHGHFVFKVGTGTPTFGSLNAETYKQVSRLRYNLNTRGGPVSLQGEEDVLASGKSNVALLACDAVNAFAFGGFIFIPVPVPFGWIICPPDDEDFYDYYAFMARRDRDGIMQDNAIMTPVSDVVRMEEGQHVESGELIAYTSFGMNLGKPIFCGPPPSAIYAMHGITMPLLYGLRYGVDLRVLREDDTMISTSTLNCQNANDGGVGVRAVAATGMVGYGNTGCTGVTYGSNNGIGCYGVVQDPPGMDPDDYKYAVCGNAGPFTGNIYAGLFLGLTAGTSPFMTTSDGRLKKNIRPTAGALQMVNLLHPSTYEFMDDTPYPLATGDQHGFIAQELEEVFPELVRDIVLPTSLEYDQIGTSPGKSYKAINYTGLIPILTASIQEMDDKVIRLENELDVMRTKVEELTALVEKLSK